MLKLVIGNKAYSSWSLRPWIALRHLGIPFEEEVIPLDHGDTAERIGAVSPGGRVPVLIDGGIVVWESLAILEYLAEEHPSLWPADREARAVARSIANEMHAGFAGLRKNYPMNVRRRILGHPATEDAEKDIWRIISIWRETRERFGKSGPFLFGGEFTAADAMYAPVATRFRTYGIATDDSVVSAYVEAIMSLPAMADWIRGAETESWMIEKYEQIAEAYPPPCG